MVVIWIQDRIEGKMDILYDIAADYRKYIRISIKSSGHMENGQNPSWTYSPPDRGKIPLPQS